MWQFKLAEFPLILKRTWFLANASSSDSSFTACEWSVVSLTAYVCICRLKERSQRPLGPAFEVSSFLADVKYKRSSCLLQLSHDFPEVVPRLQTILRPSGPNHNKSPKNLPSKLFASEFAIQEGFRHQADGCCWDSGGTVDSGRSDLAPTRSTQGQ